MQPSCPPFSIYGSTNRSSFPPDYGIGRRWKALETCPCLEMRQGYFVHVPTTPPSGLLALSVLQWSVMGLTSLSSPPRCALRNSVRLRSAGLLWELITGSNLVATRQSREAGIVAAVSLSGTLSMTTTVYTSATISTFTKEARYSPTLPATPSCYPRRTNGLNRPFGFMQDLPSVAFGRHPAPQVNYLIEPRLHSPSPQVC